MAAGSQVEAPLSAVGGLKFEWSVVGVGVHRIPPLIDGAFPQGRGNGFAITPALVRIDYVHFGILFLNFQNLPILSYCIHACMGLKAKRRE